MAVKWDSIRSIITEEMSQAECDIWRKVGESTKLSPQKEAGISIWETNIAGAIFNLMAQIRNLT